MTTPLVRDASARNVPPKEVWSSVVFIIKWFSLLPAVWQTWVENQSNKLATMITSLLQLNSWVCVCLLLFPKSLLHCYSAGIIGQNLMLNPRCADFAQLSYVPNRVWISVYVLERDWRTHQSRPSSNFSYRSIITTNSFLPWCSAQKQRSTQEEQPYHNKPMYDRAKPLPMWLGQSERVYLPMIRFSPFPRSTVWEILRNFAFQG